MSQHSIGTTTAPRTRRPWLALLACAAAAFAAGCSSGGEDTSNSGTGIVVNPPTAIAQESADDYNNNANGLITAATLQNWITNWTTNRPAGVTGKLVVLQTAGAKYPDATGDDCAVDGPLFVASDTNVKTYCVPTSAWVMHRSNGVIRTTSMVLDGPSVDALLKKYGIDPRRDMIVCAMANGSTSGTMQAGRCWYLMRYWGVAKERLAVLDGSIASAITAGTLTSTAATPTTPPNNGTVSVKDLPVDNTALQASLDEMIKLAGGFYSPPGGAFIWDARGPNEYNGVAGSTGGTSGGKVAFEGHIRGAVNLNFVNLLRCATGCGEADPANSYAYRDKATLRTLMAGMGYQPGQTVYTYCRTTYRAMVTGIAAGVVLGYPIKFYDGAFIEWGTLANYQNRDGGYNLPSDSPWRAELYTDSLTYNPFANVESGEVVNPYASNANDIISADKAYKNGGLSGSGGGGGGAPSNPCG